MKGVNLLWALVLVGAMSLAACSCEGRIEITSRGEADAGAEAPCEPPSLPAIGFPQLGCLDLDGGAQ